MRRIAYVVGRGMVAAAVAMGAWAGAAVAAEQYAIDASHSTIGFSVPHMMISRVHGAFNEVDGTIAYDEADPANSAVSVTIKAASIDTRHDKRDAHLRNEDFFDVEKFPEITFQSTRIERDGEGYAAVGHLTLHGVTKEVRLPFRVLGTIQDPRGKTRLGIEAETVLNRRDYGILWNKAMDNGGGVIGDEVKVLLTLEAVHTP